LIAQDYESQSKGPADDTPTGVGKERLIEAADSLGG
jgi:hypothetical protein